MKNGIKKTIPFIIAAAMLSAGVYAETAEEVVEVTTSTAVPSEEVQIASEEPAENDIAFEEPASSLDEEYFPDEETLPDGAGSHEAFPELGDIHKYLAENGWPDYVSFIFNSGAAVNGYDPSSGEEYQPKMTYMWEVGLVNATAEQKAEIQALIDELYPIENIITFVECRYSYAEREAMLPEIRENVMQLFPDLTGINVYLILSTEQIGVTLDFPESNGTDYEMVREKLYSIYGDIIFISEFYETKDDAGYDFDEIGGAIEAGMGGGAEIAEEESAPTYGIAEGSNEDVDAAPTVGEIAAVTPPEQSDSNTVLWVCIVAALAIALIVGVIIYRAKLIPVYATSSGDVAVSKKQAEEAVKNSEVTPDDSVLQAIKEKIDK